MEIIHARRNEKWYLSFNLIADKQIKVEKKHIDYIIKRIDRSYEKISQFISILDKYSLKKSNPFNLKLIKEVLKMI